MKTVSTGSMPEASDTWPTLAVSEEKRFHEHLPNVKKLIVAFHLHMTFFLAVFCSCVFLSCT